MKQESNRQRTMEDIDGGLHPAVDGQSLGEGEMVTLKIVSAVVITLHCVVFNNNGHNHSYS